MAGYKNIEPRITSENAREMQALSAAKRRSNAERVKLIDDNLDEILSELNKDRPLKDFAALGRDARNQFQRIYLASLAHPKEAQATLERIIDRVKGKPAKTLNLGNAEGNPFGITVNDQATADHIAGVLDEFNK